MSSRITIILAGFFLIGALLAGYWGLVLSRPPAEPVIVDVAPTPAPVAASVLVWFSVATTASFTHFAAPTGHGQGGDRGCP